MGLGRRKIRLDDASAWVFNRMAHVYDARPPYPPTLIDALAQLAGPAGGRIADIGAGIGHLALPLAERAFDVTAIEPALAMLERLQAAARARGLTLRALHATAEALPLERHSCELVVIADALHFLDAELTGRELRRVLAPTGALALVTCELGDTPFMRALLEIMQASAPRRPRAVSQAIEQLSTLADVKLEAELRLHDETPLDHAALERILRSISFIGPAMNPARFAAFSQRVVALSPEPVWARTFTLRSGLRRA